MRTPVEPGQVWTLSVRGARNGLLYLVLGPSLELGRWELLKLDDGGLRRSSLGSVDGWAWERVL